MKKILDKECTPTIYVGEYRYLYFILKLTTSLKVAVLTQDYKSLAVIEKPENLQMFIDSLK
jgi:hypothetical protein